jgi:hypothetical protein
MNRTKDLVKIVAGGLLLAAVAISPALAVTNSGGGAATPYVAAFAPVFGGGAPHSGDMRLVVNNGTISGTYSGTSFGPDYLDNRMVPVSGTLSENDGYVQLSIGGALTMHGTMANDGTISGTADYHGRLYEFVAQPGSAGSGR